MPRKAAESRGATPRARGKAQNPAGAPARAQGPARDAPQSEAAANPKKAPARRPARKPQEAAAFALPPPNVPLLSNEAVAALLDEAADLLEIMAANPFRVRAYRNAARIVRGFERPLSQLLRDPDVTLSEVPGIGTDLAGKIVAAAVTGDLALLHELRAEIPAGTRDLLKVPGIGPKKALRLQKELGVHSLQSLRQAARAHRLRDMRGFGEASEDAILNGLSRLDASTGRMLVSEARSLAAALTAHLRAQPGLGRLAVAGSLRRFKETIGDIDIVATCRDPESLMDRMAGFEPGATVLARGGTKLTIRLAGGRQVDLRIVPPESFGAALLYFTGSKAHNIQLRRRAQERGLKLNEYGVFAGTKRRAGATEEDVYACLGLPWIPPELREAHDEIALAEQGRLPRLVALGDIGGDLHAHTDATDGRDSLETMAQAALARGYSYFAVTDHSRRVTMAKGLDESRVRRQWSAIDAVRKRFPGIVILKGIELDIREDGSLDLDADLLAGMDWVIGAVHYGQGQSAPTITRRMVAAMRSGLVDAIAHPSGRLIGERPASRVDLEEVFRVAAETGCALEINGQPQRLDLDEAALGLSAKYPVSFVLNSDAHAATDFGFMEFAVAMARKAGLPPSRIVNAAPWDVFRRRLDKD